MLKIIQKLMGDPHKKEIAKISPIVQQINNLEPEIKALSDEELKGKTYEFRQKIADAIEGIEKDEKRFKKEQEVLEEILPEAYAVVREAAWRILGERAFDVQLMGGIVLHRGQIAEMKTGEGKTLTSIFPTYLNALGGRGVHIVTVNDYLARRDAEWMGQVHRFLGLTVGSIQHHLSSHERQKVYASDIVYGTNNEYGFDYLRDNMSTEKGQLVQRQLHYAIIDEVDSILIDEARTPLIISGALAQPAETYIKFAQIAHQFEGKQKEYNKKKSMFDEVEYDEDEQDCDYIVDEKQKNVIMTERGIMKAQKILDIEDLFSLDNPQLAHHTLIALKAKELYRRDIEYVIRPNERGEDECVIVDEFTGRLMFGRRYSDGLHQAIEAKEGVKIQDETQTLATITFQNFFRIYKKLAGMTGTAVTEEAEFGKIYSLPVVVVPTNRPNARQDLADVIYKNEDVKFKAVADEVEAMHQQKRPVLVGTVSIEKSERIGDILKRRGIRHNVLNAKNHEKEAEIIAQAGRKAAVTIATNMAGRGTDILLGGNPKFLMIQRLRQMGINPDEVEEEMEEKILSEMKDQVDREFEEVKSVGGLHVIGTERHESRRIDNQLRGRSGRQGDPGSTRFFLSLNDDLMRMFGGERIQKVMEMLKVEEDMPIEAPMVTKAVENAQKKVEMYHFGVRKSILEYDEVMNGQRTIIYDQRQAILEGDSLRPVVEKMLKDNMKEFAEKYAIPGVPPEEWDLESCLKEIAGQIPLLASLDPDELRMPAEPLVYFLEEQALNAYEAKETILGEDLLRDLERMIILKVIDQKWIDHLHEMEALRDGIGLRAYGQKDPLIEYKREGRDMFQDMLRDIRYEVVTTLFHMEIEYEMPSMPMENMAPEEFIFNLNPDGEFQIDGLPEGVSLDDIQVEGLPEGVSLQDILTNNLPEGMTLEAVVPEGEGLPEGLTLDDVIPDGIPDELVFDEDEEQEEQKEELV